MLNILYISIYRKYISIFLKVRVSKDIYRLLLMFFWMNSFSNEWTVLAMNDSLEILGLSRRKGLQNTLLHVTPLNGKELIVTAKSDANGYVCCIRNLHFSWSIACRFARFGGFFGSHIENLNDHCCDVFKNSC